MCTSPLVRFSVLGSDKWRVVSLKNFLSTPQFNSKCISEQIPCGQCVECRASRKQQDGFRCLKQVECYDKNIMITLTYNDENLPYVNEKTGEVTVKPTLRPSDFAKFKKRLRKSISPLKIKTFDCGEYGDIGNRPHYHSIIMNYDPGDLYFWKWSVCEWNPNIRNKLYRSPTLEKLWPLGFVEINEVNYETCCYVAGYIEKKLTGQAAKDEYESQGLIAPFTTRSQNLGTDYFIKHKEDFFNEKKIYVQTQKKLQEIKPGRYFDKLMEKTDPERYAALKEKRRQRAQDILDEVLRKTSLSKEEYLEQRDRLNRKRFERKVRQL